MAKRNLQELNEGTLKSIKFSLWPLLAVHARTIALTLRFLPRKLRDPLSLGYLLARASDTVADAPRVDREQKLLLLEELHRALESQSFEWETSTIWDQLSASEAELLEITPLMMNALAVHSDRRELLRLWRTILKGQVIDLKRFGHEAEPLTSEELEEYCDLVAGTVGETWTQLIALHEPDVLLGNKAEMVALGIGFGKGLQLLNIVRDRLEDQRLGRFYIREEEVPAMMELTKTWLNQGSQYCRALRPGRIRYASELPLRIALRTLEQIGKSPESKRVKLPRWKIYATLIANFPSLVLPERNNPAS